LGHVAGKYQSLGVTLDFIAKFVPINKTYSEAPRYNRYFNNTELYKTVFNKENKAIIIHKYFENARQFYRLTQNKWSEGILASILAARGLNVSKSTLDYCIFPLFEILQKNFKYLNLDLQSFYTREEVINGKPRKTFYHEEKQFAREVFLQKVLLSQEKKKINRKSILYDHEIFDNIPVEFEDLKEDNVDSLIESKQITKVSLITSELVIDDEILF
jgi:hypothetical protein